MDQINKIFVRSGQLIVTASPVELVTILGSCVSVCLWDKKLKLAGMNHYLLPESTTSTSHSNSGITATKMLIQYMIKRIGSIKNIEAKIFGGGNRFFENFLVVGPQNVEVAKKVLRETGIPIVVEDTGGKAGRKINFNTQTGNVIVSLVDDSHFQSE